MPVVMGSVVRGTFVLLVALLCGLPATAAHAYEDTLGLAIDATYGRVVPDSRRPDGVLLGVTASIGLDDTWTTRVRLAYGAHPGTDAHPEALQLGLASADLIYLFDILEWVPYFGVGLDVLTVNDSIGFAAESGVHIAAGLDWLATRELVIGLDLRTVTLLSALDDRPFYFALTLSLGWLVAL